MVGRSLVCIPDFLGMSERRQVLSMDLLAQKAFGEKGSYLSSAMISFTQIGWFGVGSRHVCDSGSRMNYFGDSKTAMWALVIGAGVMYDSFRLLWYRFI